LRGKGKT